MGNNGSVAGNITDNASLVFANPMPQTYSGVINGSGTITKQAAGTLTLNNTNTCNGGTTISAGVLQLGDGAASNGSIAGSVTDNASLVFANPTAQTFSTPIGGAGSVTKQAAGALTLPTANSFFGGATLTAGQLNINNAQALGDGSGTFTITGGAIDNTSSGALTTLDYSQAWNGDFTFVGTKDLNLGIGAVTLNATRTVTVNGGDLTVGGALSGTGFGLTKAGSGVLTLSGASGYSGVTTINAGTLRMGADYALPSASQVVVAGGATLDMSGYNGSIAALSGPGSIINNSGLLGIVVTGDLTTGSTYQNYSCIYGVITNGALIKDGTHALALRETNTLTIPVTLNSKSSSAGTLSVGVIPNQLRPTDALFVPSGALFQLDANNQTVAGLADDGWGGSGSIWAAEP